MKKINKMTPKGIVLILALAIFASLCAVGCSNGGGIQEVLTEEEYTYVNPDESKAETDTGIVIDGVLEEAAYQNNNWLYLHNDDGGNDVDIAMTSYYGEKGMYFVYDVTESVPIYVNLERASYMNSCIEMYFAPSSVTSLGENSLFEIDMLPTGDMVFKKSNGKGGYVNVSTTDDIMAYLGATTKGGEINSGDCYGYCLELFIPWEYMEWVGMDADAMKESFVYVDPAHITSFNYTGTDTSVDRYWYFYAQQQGATFSNVFQYFRFDGTGALGTVPVELTEGENYTIEANPSAIPGMKTTITIKPETGFALNSILVNGEEYIREVSYNADGSVDLVIRPGEEGLKISAAAEAVTEGTKTLTGTVRLANLEEDTLEGVQASYKGPTGEKPLTLDENGSFCLENLEQGYYSLEIEKEGYQSISRSICLNRDMDMELVLEFDTFFTQNGSAFVLDEQNNGVVQKFGGTGYIMSNKAYDMFTYEMNIRYDADLAKEADTDAFKQQRTGMRIQFSNGKYWYLDLLKEGNNYILQYAKHSNSIFDKWVGVCKLDEMQIAKYKSEEGINLKVVRDGRFAGIYLDDILLRVEKLDYEYAHHTAQLGMESWSANRGVMEIPYSIDDGIRVCVAESDFYRAGNWNITGQYDGYVMLNNGGDGGWLNFGEKQLDSDVSLIVKDDPKVADAKGGFRTVIKYTFDNGKTASFSIYYNENGEYVVQSMGDTVFGWKTHHVLTSDEVAKLKGDGIELRVVRIGTEVSCYLGGNEIVSGADLTVGKDGKATGIKVNTAATVSIRHYGDEGIPVMIPYENQDKLDYVTVTSVPDVAGNKVSLNKDSYVRGDIVKLTDSGEGAYYPYAMKVNGKAVALDAYGGYAFEAVEDEYTVEGEYAERVFKNSADWSEVAQKDGILTIPCSDGDSGWIESYSATYKDVDLKLTLRDQDTAADNYRAAVRMAFGNGEWVTFTLTNDQSNSDAPTNYTLQNMGGSIQNWAQVKGYSLRDEQVAKLQSEAGLEFRVVRVGDVVDLYVGGEHVYEFDLSVRSDGKASNVAKETTNIQLRFYGNTGKDVEVPFTIGTNVELVSVTCKDSENGSVSVDQKNYIKGDTATVTVKGDAGYYYTDLTVDGKSVTVDADSSYSFTAVSSHEVSASFGEGVFMDYADNVWSLANQNKGLLHIDAANNGAGWMQTKDNWNELSLTVKDYAGGTVNEYAVVGQLYFSNGKYATVRLIRNLGSSNYTLQCMNDNIFKKWTNWHTLTAEQAAKVQGEGIEFRMTRIGTTLNLYLDDVLVKKLDLTTNNSGVTADMPCVAKVRYYNSKGYDVTLPFALANPEQKVTVNVAANANGSITADKTGYLAGDTVKLTVKPNSGYCFSALYVDGKAVTLADDGTYSFVATKDTYDISADFAAAVWNPDKNTGNTWNTTWQSSGILKTSAANSDTGWMYTHGNGYRDVALTVQDKTPNAKDFRAAVQFEFTNGKVFRISLTNADSGELGVYKIQTMGSNNIVGNWKTPYRLSDAEVSKLQSSGLQFRVAIAGTTAQMYLDNELVCTYDLSAGISSEMAALVVRLYGNNGYADTIPFVVGDGSGLVAVNIPDTTNGTVTADKNSYRIGDTVKLTVDADDGYYYTGLYVNGAKVDVAKDGTYSFTATSNSYTVTCGFAEGVFKENNANWDLTEQNIGILSVPSTVTGNTGWMDTKANWNELSITVKDYSGGTVHEYAAAGGFYFTNGKYVSIRLISFTDSGKYVLQSMGDSPFNWATHYTLTAEQVAKVQGGGIKLTMTRRGTRLDLYLDGVAVATNLDLTSRSSGITPDMTCIARVRYYNFGYAAEMPFELGNPDQNAAVNIAASNGTVTTDKSSYKLGETVTLTAKPNSGYYLGGMTVNGVAVDVDKNGVYSFKATENSYDVSAWFGAGIFIDNNNWDLTGQLLGLISQKNTVTGNASWLLTQRTDYKDVEVAVTIKPVGTGDTKINDSRISIQFGHKQNGNDFWTSFSVLQSGSTYKVINRNGDNVPFTTYTLTAEEVAQIQNGGIEFRVVKTGTTVNLYLGGKLVVENIDLTKGGTYSYMTADTPVQIKFKVDDNPKATVEIPFSITE